MSNLLDDSDDTNNSATDFSEVAPNPRPNSAPIAEVTCSPGGPGVTQNPVSPSKKKKMQERKKPSGSGGAPAYAAKKKKCRKRK
jgi:hypothetical protein